MSTPAILITGGAGFVGSHVCKALATADREVVEAVETVTRRSVRVKTAERRLGDPTALVANPELARRELGWRACYPKMEEQVQHAAEWIRKNLTETSQDAALVGSERGVV